MMRPPNRRNMGPAPKINMKTVKRLFSYLGKYKIRLAIVMLCMLLSSAASVAASMFLKTLIDDYIAPLLLEAAPVFTGLLKALVAIGCVYLVGLISTFLQGWLMVKVSQGTLKTIRDEMFEHMQTLPIKYFDANSYGDVMSRYTNDTDSMRQMISQSIPQLVSSAVMLVMVFVSMLSSSLWLTLFVVVFLVLMLQLTGKIAGKSGKYFVEQQKSLGDVNGYIEEMMQGQRVVKVFCHEEKAKKMFDEKNTELCKNATLANRFANILMPIMNNMGNLLYVLVAIVGGALAVQGVTNISLTGINVLTLGTIAAFLQLTRSFMQPVNQVSQQVNAVAMALAGAERIFALMDEEPESDEGTATLVNAKYENGVLTQTDRRSGLWAWKREKNGEAVYTELKGDIRMQEVDFAYEEGKNVLHDITLYAEPGQKVAFVGATGAGKTTITNLINRFYDIADGKIRYDGINVNNIKKSDLRRSLGVVLQDVSLFTGTVMDNIRYGKLDATDEECIAAAKLANAHDFISRLPEGYDTLLTGDGSGLSQGQRQLISIARAAVADPPVMILDEATSSIDTRTEQIVQSGMDALMEGRTVFVIAHRLSTVRNSDVIMVLELGRIIERGTHEQLLEEKGTYYRLYTGAFELD